MTETTLFNALEQLTAAARAFTDFDLEQPYTWGAHGEGVRFALLGTHFELQALTVQLVERRAENGPPLTKAQRLLGQFHAAYRDWQAVLAGFDSADYDKKPTPADWPMRYVLGHMARTQMTFYALADYGLQMGQDASLPEKFPGDAVEKIFGPAAAFREVMDSQGLPEMTTLFDNVHRQTLEHFAAIPDEMLDTAGPIWWEGQQYPIHYRLGRMEAHLRQHTIQAVKTRTAVAGPLSEAIQLIRLLYHALAGLEATVLGAPNLGRTEQAALAESIIKRAETVTVIVQQAGALLEAVKKGDTAAVQKLLAANPDLVNAVNQQGLPAVLVAVYYSQGDIANILRNAGAEMSLFELAALGDLEKVQAELADWPEDIHEFGRDGFNPLQLACYFGHAELAAWLVEQGADVNAVARNEMKIQPLHAAAARGNEEIVRMLLENEADVNGRQQGDFTPLHAAAQNGDVPLARLLLEHGADATLKTAEGKTAADLARTKGHTEILQWIE
jgi:ankyrin repeat protein